MESSTARELTRQFLQAEMHRYRTSQLVSVRPDEFRKDIDAPLILGAALFGIGWGIAGYCPGPALTALANLSAEAFVFVAAMIGGGLFARILPSKGPGA